MNEYNEPCPKECTAHKYHCAICNAACSYSPANYASRPQDIPNQCLNYLKHTLNEKPQNPNQETI